MTNKNSVFKGVATALITPFCDTGIDFCALEALIERQIEGGANALLLLGTTGEASTVNEDERCDIIAFAKEKIRGRVPLIVGTGTNNTAVTVRYSKQAYYSRADALLVVTPYYNKANAEGLYQHYMTVAKSTPLPIILYNVPPRTGVNLPISVLKRLSSISSIVGIKEASGNLTYASEILDTLGDFFDLYTGNDDLTLPTLALGGAGVISVVSNLLPWDMSTLCSAFFENDIKTARKIQLSLCQLIRTLFSEVNPIPVKSALSLLGLCKNQFRLPLTPYPDEVHLKEILTRYKLTCK